MVQSVVLSHTLYPLHVTPLLSFFSPLSTVKTRDAKALQGRASSSDLVSSLNDIVSSLDDMLSSLDDMVTG